jgi:hypothetical protein
MDIIATYSIEYPKYNVIQEKNLVEHELYLLIKEGMSREDNPLPKDTMKKTFGDEFFTTQSPLGMALLNNTNLVLPENQGGEHEIKFKKL